MYEYKQNSIKDEGYAINVKIKAKPVQCGSGSRVLMTNNRQKCSVYIFFFSEIEFTYP
jgi:hypothetical protein